MKIIAFTGAGISKSAGIPTFEEVPGLKDKLSIDFKQNHPIEFTKTIKQLIANFRHKKPTKAHNILALFNVPIITMNIDCLHTKAGSKKVFEIHGNYKDNNIVLYGEKMLCSKAALSLLFTTAVDAQKTEEEVTLLIIGTSMQTSFANVLKDYATQLGITIKEINTNADVEVPKFFKDLYGI